ncbi:MFS transporter [Streptomyces sp. NPDC052207]|uniref:MFS transporter n=1 Tax=Streptomyces sp. NPDC052207 TaxID=3155418 RepID=UPI00344A4FC6
MTKWWSPRTATAPALGDVGIGVLLACAFLPIVDFFIVNVALPTIDSTLYASEPALELVVAGYGTAYAALQVLGGRLGDSHGRRRMLLLGLSGFTATSLLCGLAPSVGTLVVARLAQGASSALLVPQVLATFQTALESKRRHRALGLYGAVAGLAIAVGQLFGGLLVTANIAGATWRPIFLVNVPIGLALLVAIPRLVPDTRSAHPAGIDLPGTLLFTATLTALLIPLAEGRDVHWAAWTWVLLAAAPVLALATYAVERRAEARGVVPLLPPSLLALRSVKRGLLLGMPFFMGIGGFMLVMALTMQDSLQADALHSGLTMLPLALALLIGSLFVSRMIDRFGRRTLAAGALSQAVGLSILIAQVSTAWPRVPLPLLAPGLALVGLGQAWVFGALFRLLLADVPAHLAGVGGGVFNTLQQGGLALGVASLGTLYLGVAGSQAGGVLTAFILVVGLQTAVALLLSIGSRTMPAPAHMTAAPVAVEV